MPIFSRPQSRWAWATRNRVSCNRYFPDFCIRKQKFERARSDASRCRSNKYRCKTTTIQAVWTRSAANYAWWCSISRCCWRLTKHFSMYQQCGLVYNGGPANNNKIWFLIVKHNEKFSDSENFFEIPYKWKLALFLNQGDVQWFSLPFTNPKGTTPDWETYLETPKNWDQSRCMLLSHMTRISMGERWMDAGTVNWQVKEPKLL